MTYDWPLILAYHHIVTGKQSRYSMSADALDRQLTYLLDNDFEALSLQDALAVGPFGSADAKAKTFTVTFDDGLISLKTLAMPVLERLGLAHATTTFVPTEFVGGNNAWREEPTLLQRIMPWAEFAEDIMGWDDLAQLASAGVAVESHGHGHLKMNQLTYEEARDDITTSLRLLGEHGHHARYFALPYGWHSEECERAIADAGIDAAVSVKWGGRNRFEVRRIPIYGTDSALTTRLKFSGRYFEAFDIAARLAGKKRYKK